MEERYKIVYREGEAEIVEKKSRFLSVIHPVETEEEAIAFIEARKKKYWDASHNCYAYLIGARNEIQRCSDDGEPGGTAGRPMLDVLLGEGVHNVCAVVTRYFGGTLLGTGGLVRAYGKSVQEGLKEALIVEKCLADRLLITTDYNGVGKVQYILGQRNISVLDSRYTDIVEMEVLVPVSQRTGVMGEVTEGTGGKAVLEVLEQVYYGIIDKNVVVFKESP